MDKPLIEFVFQGSPVPYTRYNKDARWREQVQRYYEYKSDLARALKAEFGYFAWDIPDAGPARAKYIKSHRYDLSLRVYREADRGDLDNFAKAVADALQDAGILANDVQIDGYALPFEKLIDKTNPRVEIALFQRK